VGPSFFLPPRPMGPHHRFLYFGTVWSALDYEAISGLANAGFEVTMIGPVKEPPPPLPTSVSFLGPVAYEDLPSVISVADALLLPYADTEYNKGVIPAKIYECLATGLPVLSSPLPALKALSDLSVLSFARTPEEWVAAARSLDHEPTAARNARVSVARAHEEGRMFERLRTAVISARRDSAPAARAARRPGMMSGIGWIALLYGLAKASTLITQMIAGRWLGPAEYGRANLAAAAAAYLQILPMLGFPTALGKLLAIEIDDSRRARLISTALIGFAAWFAFALPAMALAHGALESALGMPRQLFVLSVQFASTTALYTVVASPLLGIKRFAHRGLAEAVYGFAAPVFMILFFTLRTPNHESFIFALSAALAVGALYSLWPLRRYLKPVFEPAAFTGVLRYASVATLNLLAAACILAPARMLLHRHVTANAVGVFSAYFTSTVQISLAILYMLQSALIPLASDEAGQREAWSVYRRAVLPAGGASFVFFFIAGAAALAAFGRNYPLDTLWLAAFALAATLALAHGTASALLSARDFEGLCVSAGGGLLAGLGNAMLAAWLIPKWGVPGAAAALCISFSAGLAWYGAYAAWRRLPS
ncbi:MAG: oligosaccharide flippase family protein, partial [Elusimicrobiota bacterium]